MSTLHIEGTEMELIVFVTPRTRCAVKSPVTAQRLLKWSLQIQNILALYLTRADHKQAYKSWPELSQQMDIWVYLHFTAQCTQS